MFGLFRKKTGEPIEFETAEAAFDYACRNLENLILLEAVIPALVVERRGTGTEGEQLFLVRLANCTGGKVVETCTLSESLRHPSVGDLVGFRVVKLEPELPEPFDLLGFIAYRLQPVYVPGRGWRIAESFVPHNIKPTLRM